MKEGGRSQVEGPSQLLQPSLTKGNTRQEALTWGRPPCQMTQEATIQLPTKGGPGGVLTSHFPSPHQFVLKVNGGLIERKSDMEVLNEQIQRLVALTTPPPPPSPTKTKS